MIFAFNREALRGSARPANPSIVLFTMDQRIDAVRNWMATQNAKLGDVDDVDPSPLRRVSFQWGLVTIVLILSDRAPDTWPGNGPAAETSFLLAPGTAASSFSAGRPTRLNFQQVDLSRLLR